MLRGGPNTGTHLEPAAAPAETAGDGQTAYIRDLVKSGDRDLYLSALFAPEPQQQSLLALYAFCIEIARIPDQVSEAQLGEIRLQWWRDALSAAWQTGEAEHPVLDAIAAASRAHLLPVEPLQRMIDARSFDLQDKLMPDAEALSDHIDATAGVMFVLGARILGMDDARGQSEQAARAFGLAAIMRALPHDTAKGRIFLPETLLAIHGLHPNAILSGADKPDLRAALRDLRGESESALEDARRAFARLPRAYRPAFLPLATVASHLRRLAKPDHDPMRHVVQLNPLVRFWLIWRSFTLGRL